MTRRLGGALLWTLVPVLIVFAATACSRGSSVSPVSSSAVSLAPSPAGDTLARTDPAVWAAVRFEQTRCSWDWRRPLTAYVAAQQPLATPQYRGQLAAEIDAVSWLGEVVAARQQVTCTVSAPHRLVGAPSTATSVYVRMSVTEQVTSTLGSFTGGGRTASWLVRRINGRWLVAGTFTGG